MDLRPYQSQIAGEVQSAWGQGARNVVMRLDTGGGKSVILAWLVAIWVGAVAVIAHRQELVSQLSHTLAKHGIRHNIIAADKVRRAIIASHMAEYGRSFYDPGSRVAVASVDTLIRVDASWFTAWCAQVTLWVTDEGHHVVRDNKWHAATKLFTNAGVHGLLPTATPGRADGKGLGAHADGVAHAMVEGPPMRWLIDQKYLSDYRIICPETDLAILDEVGSSGDWSPKQLKEASANSHITGDVVKNYLRWGAGTLGITFTTDLETAAKMAARYNASGVRAEVISGVMDDGFRRQVLRRFAAREIDQIVTVDIISEGFDLPAVETVTLARPTQSLPLYMQQFGRGLRIMPGKTRATIIDLAGNTLRHQGPPDKPRVWSLDRREGKGGGGGIPMRVCGAGHSTEARAQLEAQGRNPCYQPFERFHTKCPYCSYPLPQPEPGGRAAPKMVDGDTAELDAETLARLRGEISKAQMPREDYARWLTNHGATQASYGVNMARHDAALAAHRVLRQAVTAWTRRQLDAGLKDREIHKLFYFRFGVDVLSAQALNRKDAETLTAKVQANG